MEKKISEQTDYKQELEAIYLRLGELQREIRIKKIPLLIIIEGWDAAGKGTLVSHIIEGFDPRGYTVHTFPISDPAMERYPYLHRYFIAAPPKGAIAIFLRSWYTRVLHDRVEKTVSKKKVERAFQEIINTEAMLQKSGMVIIKIFLNITKKEQRERFDKLESSKKTSWRVADAEWKQHAHYKKMEVAIHEMIQRTSFPGCFWYNIDATDKKFTSLQAAKILVQSLEKAIADKTTNVQENNIAVEQEKKTDIPDVLSELNLSLTFSEDEYNKKLDSLQDQLTDIQNRLYRKRIPVIIAFEGWDAAGKGGAIRRLVRSFDPRGYHVIPISAPDEFEKNHHYLWRFLRHTPRTGHITIFDRTWYGRVLVERVEKFATPEEWQRAYKEINQMEEYLAAEKVKLFKFWLHTDEATQLARFEDRTQTTHKQWKITDEDWRNRERREDYNNAVNEMIFRTSTAHSPWTLVEANDKKYARIKILQSITNGLSDLLH